MQIGLLGRAARAADGGIQPARCIGAQCAGRKIWLLMDLPGVQVWKHVVANVLQNERLAPVAHDEPVTFVDSHLVHFSTPRKKHAGALHRSPEAWMRDAIGQRCSSNSSKDLPNCVIASSR